MAQFILFKAGLMGQHTQARGGIPLTHPFGERTEEVRNAVRVVADERPVHGKNLRDRLPSAPGYDASGASSKPGQKSPPRFREPIEPRAGVVKRADGDPVNPMRHGYLLLNK
jgi:hypothetical protein